ncbi:MAG: type II toxin-antitoxin system Phd/YefM family antitoxin [Verrucomicrobia bacterium]|nr:type II toxin-antitoxin system Phd/YefM family antitoxin [Verrucomicrobiota bacterium]
MLASRTPSEWQLQTAKAQFSKVVASAVECGPQLVTKAGTPAVYIISAEMFDSEFAHKVEGRKEILLASPHRDTDLDLARSQDEGREVAL